MTKKDNARKQMLTSLSDACTVAHDKVCMCLAALSLAPACYTSCRTQACRIFSSVQARCYSNLLLKCFSTPESSLMSVCACAVARDKIRA